MAQNENSEMPEINSKLESKKYSLLTFAITRKLLESNQFVTPVECLLHSKFTFRVLFLFLTSNFEQ